MRRSFQQYWTSVLQIYYNSSLLIVLALGSSKASVAALLLRLGDKTRHAKLFRAGLTFVICWTIGALCATALQCDPRSSWTSTGDQCKNTVSCTLSNLTSTDAKHFWIQALGTWIMCTFDILIEVSFVFMAIELVFQLHTPRNVKTMVVVGFAFRLM